MRYLLLILLVGLPRYCLFAQYLGDTSFEKDTIYNAIPPSSPWKSNGSTWIVPGVYCTKNDPIDGSKYLLFGAREQASDFLIQKLKQQLVVGKEYEISLYLRNNDTSKSWDGLDSPPCKYPLGWSYLEFYMANSKNVIPRYKYVQKDSALINGYRKVWRSPKVDFLDWRKFTFTFLADSAYVYMFMYFTPNQNLYMLNIDYITFRATDEPEPALPMPTITAINDGLERRRKVVLRFGK